MNKNHDFDHISQKWQLFFSAHKQTIIYSILGLIAFILVIGKFSYGSSTHAEKSYYNAVKDADQLSMATGEQRIKIIDNLKKQVSKHPELKTKYDGLISQYLLIENSLSSTKNPLQGSFKRIKKDISDNYIDYSRNSISISQGQYQEALEEALLLKQKMSEVQNNQDNYQDTLIAYNLLRIAMLYQVLEQYNNENQAWNDLKDFANWENPEKTTPPACIIMVQNFQEGQVNLLDYIKYRQKLISSR